MYVVLLAGDPIAAADIRWSSYMRKVCGGGQRSPDPEDVLHASLQNIPVTADPYQRTVLFMAQLGRFMWKFVCLCFETLSLERKGHEMLVALLHLHLLICLHLLLLIC